MRKTNTIPVMAVVLCCPTLNYAQYNSYEAQVEQEVLSLFHASQITAVIDWLGSPTIKSTLLMIAACCFIRC